jgi:hypothetical protein
MPSKGLLLKLAFPEGLGGFDGFDGFDGAGGGAAGRLGGVSSSSLWSAAAWAAALAAEAASKPASGCFARLARGNGLIMTLMERPLSLAFEILVAPRSDFLARKRLHDLEAKLRVGHFATTEPEGGFDLHVVAEEVDGMAAPWS